MHTKVLLLLKISRSVLKSSSRNRGESGFRERRWSNWPYDVFGRSSRINRTFVYRKQIKMFGDERNSREKFVCLLWMCKNKCSDKGQKDCEHNWGAWSNWIIKNLIDKIYKLAVIQS